MMNQRLFPAPAFALALTLAVSSLAAQPVGCFGDDGFAAVPCCQPVSTSNIPVAPPFMALSGRYLCLDNCNIDQVFGVQVSLVDQFITCDYHIMPITIAPTGPGGPSFTSTLLAKYSRTWLEPDPAGAFNRQVWRYLVNSDFVPSAAASSPCPLPVTAAFGTVHFRGHVDYACEPNAVGGMTFSVALSLHHIDTCIEHNLFSCVPLPVTDSRSYHIVASSGPGFSFTPVPPPAGPTLAESYRSTLIPSFQCLGEGQILQGSVDPLGASCPCLPGAVGMFPWFDQNLVGTVLCNGMPSPYMPIPLSAPLPPAPSGLITRPLGRWTGPPGTFPGNRTLSIHWGILDFRDPCNPNDLPIQIVHGVTTGESPAILFNTPIPAPVSQMMDLQDMLVPVPTAPGQFLPGWGCLFISKRVWNLAIP